LSTDKLRQLLEACDHLNRVVAIGPIPMLRAVADITRKQNILTIVSLNPIMIDRHRHVGGCRVLVDGESRFAGGTVARILRRIPVSGCNSC